MSWINVLALFFLSIYLFIYVYYLYFFCPVWTELWVELCQNDVMTWAKVVVVLFIKAIKDFGLKDLPRAYSINHFFFNHWQFEREKEKTAVVISIRRQIPFIRHNNITLFVYSIIMSDRRTKKKYNSYGTKINSHLWLIHKMCIANARAVGPLMIFAPGIRTTRVYTLSI